MGDTMIHPTAEKLQAFVEGILDEGDRVVVSSHMVGCTNCQSEVEEWRSLFAVLGTLPSLSPAKGFADRVMLHVTLPDPWYVRAAARVGAQLQVFAPKTARGWAIASACLALPLALFGMLAAWVMSKPYVTPDGILTFAGNRLQAGFASVTQDALSRLLQSDVALVAARALERISSAGMGATGALAAVVAMATILSAWVLYQNLFRTSNTREDRTYASYSF